MKREDGSGKRGLETRLQKAEARLRALLDASPDMIFVHGPDGNLLHVNEKVEKCLGFSAEELKTLPPDNFMGGGYTPEDAAELITKARKTGSPVYVEWTARRRDGVEFPVEVRMKKLDAAEDPEWDGAVMAVVSDISLRAMAERRLRESEKKYRHLFDNLNDAAFVADVETGTLVETNRKAEGLLGRTRDEIIGMHQSELHPPGKAEEYRDKFAAHIARGRAADYDGEVITGDGRVKDVHISAAPVTLDGRELILGLFQDITVRKRAEAEVRRSREFAERLIESMKDGFSILDGEGRHIKVNRAFTVMTGYTNEDLAGTSPPFPYWSDRKRKEIEDALARSMRGDFRDYELEFRRKDGAYFPVIVSPSWLKGEDGEVICFFATMKDISERKKLEAEMVKMEKLESTGILAGGIAHDFNNLLTGILGNISFAAQIAEVDRVKARLAEAEKAAVKARGLTGRLLTFSRGGSPVKSVAALAEILRASADFVLAGSNVRCEYDIAPDLRTVEVDEDQIAQVVNNIVINADQAMPEGGVLSVAAVNADVAGDDNLPLADGEYVKVSMTDRGAGMSEDQIARAFDPFFTTRDGGTGLGLATAYSIIRKHGGAISLDSDDGGTTVTFYLPAKRCHVSAEEDDAAAPGEVSSRVLVMDDEEMILDSAAEILAHLGCSVSTAGDGREAVRLFKEARDRGEPFNVTILDLTVPGGMGGLETAREILELDPGARLVVSSGYSGDPVMSEYREHGFSGVLTKPYRAADLGRAVKDASGGE